MMKIGIRIKAKQKKNLRIDVGMQHRKQTFPLPLANKRLGARARPCVAPPKTSGPPSRSQ
jgi:hypothetical protein